MWDVVLDHDNLSRAIDQTIERISKSHLRGEDCAIYAELDKKKDDEGGPGQSLDDKATDSPDRIPRVFPMSSEVIAVGSSRDSDTPESKSRHFHPGHDDPRQYTLLKFYELNSGAVKLLLDSKDDQNMDLPFTPGPKEHEVSRSDYGVSLVQQCSNSSLHGLYRNHACRSFTTKQILKDLFY